LLDSGGRVAQGRARAVRPGDAFAPDAAAPGLLQSRGGRAPARRSRRRPRGSQPPALGPARLHALARAARRAAATGGVKARSARRALTPAAPSRRTPRLP